MSLSKIAVSKPVAIAVLMLSAVVLGIFGFQQMKVSLLPEIVYPVINVNITWSGASPEDIEDNIAEVLEPKISTIDNLDYITSTSGDGIYTLSVYFNYSTNIDAAFQDVLAMISQVQRGLPKDADAPIVRKADPSQMPIVQMMVSSENMNLVKLRIWAVNFLQKQFTAVEGTAGVDVSGGKIREIMINIKPDKMQLLNITLESLAQKLNDENVEISAGRVTAGRKDFVVRTKGRFTNIAQIQGLVISSDKNGKNIYLKDVADVVDGNSRQKVITRFNGKECVQLAVYKQQYANTVEVEEGLKNKMEQLKDALPRDIKMAFSYNQADYIKSANAGVRDAAFLAALLVTIVIWFFLTSWRRVLIVVTAMPLSILMTFFVMSLLGFSINIFSLGGLILAITIVLDDAVVVLENITRLQEERNPDAVVQGTDEVGPALTFVTLTFMALFVPFLFVPGMVSLLFHELIIIIAVAIGSSRIVSLTVTPMITHLLTKDHHEKEPENTLSKRMMDWIGKHYKTSLNFTLNHKAYVIVSTAVLFVAGIWFINSLGSELLPLTDDGQILISVNAPVGTALNETQKIIMNVEETLGKLPYIENNFSTVGGRVYGGTTFEFPEQGTVVIQLVPKKDRKVTTDEWVAKYSQQIEQETVYPGVKVFIMHRKMRGIRFTGNNDVEIQLRAPKTVEISELADQAGRIMEKIRGVKGLGMANLSMNITKPEYQLTLNRGLISDLGLKTSQIANNLKAFIDGNQVAYYKDKGFYYYITLIVNRKDYNDIEDIRNIPLLTAKGLPIYVRNVANVEQKVGPMQIDRIEQMRILSVVANVRGRPVGDVNKDIMAKLADLDIPPGWVLHYGGAAEDIKRNFGSMYIILALSLFLAYVILAIQFESFIWPFIILLRVPLSLIGISVAMYLAHASIGITVMIGFIILAGIEIVHGVILITFIQQLMNKGMSIRDAVVNGALLRLRPILMTMCVGVLGLIPLAFGLGDGTEMLKPMAIGVIGGLIFSMYLTFYFVPSVFVFVAARQEKNKAAA